jgi:hypothetical protein
LYAGNKIPPSRTSSKKNASFSKCKRQRVLFSTLRGIEIRPRCHWHFEQLGKKIRSEQSLSVRLSFNKVSTKPTSLVWAQRSDDPAIAFQANSRVAAGAGKRVFAAIQLQVVVRAQQRRTALGAGKLGMLFLEALAQATTVPRHCAVALVFFVAHG